MTNRFDGRCHCGNISLSFETEQPTEALAVRACGCSFCSARGARTTSDNAGKVRISVKDESQLSRYRFGLMTADFLVCRSCGAYMASMFTDEDGQAYATLNSRYFERGDEFPPAGRHVSYDGETAEDKRRRRRRLWTPVSEFRAG